MCASFRAWTNVTSAKLLRLRTVAANPHCRLFGSRYSRHGKMKRGKTPIVGALVFSLLVSMECVPDELNGPRAAPADGPSAVPATADFFISPRGRDQWSGKSADPGEN